MQEQTMAIDAIDIEALYEFVIAMRNGEFSKRLTVPELGRAREVAMHLNRHMENMELLLREITRVAMEVGMEGKLGPQAEVVGNGPYRQMTNAVNLLAANVTSYVRDMVWTVNAINKEGRPRKVQTNVPGEWKVLMEGLNEMVDRVSSAQRMTTDRTSQ